MKNYKEISDSVFEKSKKIISENKAKRKKNTIAVSAVVSLCIVAAICIVFAKGGLIKKESAAAKGGRYDTICDSAGAQQNNGDYSQNTVYAVSEAQSSSQSQQAEVSQPTVQKTDADLQSTKVQKTNSDSKITTTTKKIENNKKIISNYEASSMACYATPKNGEFFFSYPLTEAKKNYGSKVIYKLSIDVFTDAEFLKDEKKLAAESERLNSIGFDAELKDKNGRWVIVAQMTAEEMENFIPDSTLGYFFFLYDERDAGLNIPLS